MVLSKQKKAIELALKLLSNPSEDSPALIVSILSQFPATNTEKVLTESTKLLAEIEACGVPVCERCKKSLLCLSDIYCKKCKTILKNKARQSIR